MSIPFGKYQLLKKLAAGGMGQVFLARTGEEGFEKMVVLKRILPHLMEDQEFFEMFRDEAKVSMRLNHPNIVQIFEFGMESGVHYLTMEYVAGEDVRKMVKRIGQAGFQLPLGLILRIISDAAAGLDYAHKATDSKGNPLNIIHRDVSPQNILVGFDGAVKLIDFGVAKAAGRAQHTATGILKGKFPYMSPEQAEGDELDARSDIFALGIILWELLTGRRLFKGESDTMTQKMVRTCDVPAPSAIGVDLPKDLDTVVLKALAKNREDRYPDAGALRMAIEEYIVRKSVPASAAQLVSFLRPIYADRIAVETNPEKLDELTGESALEWSSKPPGTPSNQGKPKGATEALSRQKKGSPVWIGVAVVVALAVGGFGVFKATQKPPEVDVPKQIVVPQVTTTVTTVPDVKVPDVKPPEPVAVRVESEPPGADVERNGARLGVTPLDVRLEKASLPAILKVSHDGFEPQLATVSADSGPSVSVTLKRKARVSTGPRPPEIKTNR